MKIKHTFAGKVVQNVNQDYPALITSKAGKSAKFNNRAIAQLGIEPSFTHVNLATAEDDNGQDVLALGIYQNQDLGGNRVKTGGNVTGKAMLEQLGAGRIYAIEGEGESDDSGEDQGTWYTLRLVGETTGDLEDESSENAEEKPKRSKKQASAAEA